MVAIARVSNRAQEVMNRIVALYEQALRDGKEYLKLDAGRGYMPLVVEKISPRMWSLAHYGEQNGDAMRDPEMTFWVDGEGKFCPASYRNDYVGVDRESIVFDENGIPVRFLLREQKNEAVFVTTWMKNIAEQQGI